MKLSKILSRIAITLIVLVVLFVTVASVVYSPTYVYRMLAWGNSDSFDYQKFPFHPLDPAPTAFHFDSSPDPRVAQLFGEIAGTEDWEGYLEAQGTQAFLVIQDGTIVYEDYFNDTQRDSIVTSFSVAKSYTSALIGIAIQEGYIGSVDDPITVYLPELAQRDARFNEITVRHLLLMASGLEFKEMRPFLFNGDDPLTTYYPDQRAISLKNTHISDPPGQYFSYNKYHPQLLGMILERATGVRVTDYLQAKIWDPLGMEYAGSWSTDSEESDFEKMESGVNARAVDFAKFGELFLNGGEWEGAQVIPREWVEESTRPLLPDNYDEYYNDWVKAMPGRGYYNYMWWGMERENGTYDFTAEGDKGQFIYVSPEKDLVIVRHGLRFGIPSEEWLNLFYEFAGQY